MPHPDDERLLRHAQTKGLLTKDQVQHCLALLVESEQQGRPLRAAQILIRDRLLEGGLVVGLLKQIRDVATTNQGVIGSETWGQMAAVSSILPHVIPGTQLSGYTLKREIARGGMGVLYEAWAGTERVAIKVLSGQAASSSVVVARFQQEAQLAQQVEHPNVIKVHQLGFIEPDVHFIIMDFFEGKSLADLIRPGRLAPKKAVQVMATVADACAAMHALNLIHRDIKPSNIMVTSDNVLKITDFGLSRNMAHETALTRTGVMMGTPGYMPLEQWDARSVDHRADLFAAGVSFYEMLTGRLPYPGDTPTQILRAMILGKPTPLVQYRRDCPPSLVAVVLRLLAQRPEDRYQHAAQAVFALRDWERQQGIERVGGTPAQMPSLAISESQVAASRPVVTDSSHATAAVPDAAIGGSPMSAHFTTPPPAFSSSASSRSRAPALPGAEAPSGSQPSSNDEPDASGTIPPDGPLGTNNSGLIPEPVPNP